MSDKSDELQRIINQVFSDHIGNLESSICRTTREIEYLKMKHADYKEIYGSIEDDLTQERIT